MMRMAALAAVILSTPVMADGDQKQVDRSMKYGIIVVHDDVRSVTCWSAAEGLYCMPDWMLTKPEVKP